MSRPLGAEGEDIAVKFLRKKGYKVLQRNYRTPVGEIDIIALDKGTVVFIEVKMRLGESFGQPVEAIDRRKIRRIERAALLYVSRCKKEPRARFDVISIKAGEAGGKVMVDHLRDAFGWDT